MTSAGQGVPDQVRDDDEGEGLRSPRSSTRPQEEPIWAVYPQRRHLLPKVRLLIDKLREELPGRFGGVTELFVVGFERTNLTRRTIHDQNLRPIDQTAFGREPIYDYCPIIGIDSCAMDLSDVKAPA